MRGALRYASLRDCPGALPDFVASVELYPDQGFVEAIGEPFHSFVCLVLFHGGQNVTAALRIAIERLCENRRQVAACALRAAGHQFGLWGFRQSAEQAQLWLDAAVNRQRGREGLGFDVLEVPRLLWAANLHEAAYFLYQQCAERKLPEAAAALYALHCGRLADTPDHYRDAASAAHWLLCAAQSGSQMAKYDLACQRMRDGDGLDERRAMLSVRRMLLDCLATSSSMAVHDCSWAYCNACMAMCVSVKRGWPFCWSWSRSPMRESPGGPVQSSALLDARAGYAQAEPLRRHRMGQPSRRAAAG